MIDVHFITETDEETDKILLKIEGRFRPAAVKYMIDHLDEILQETGLTFEEFYNELQKELTVTVHEALNKVREIYATSSVES